MGFRPPSLNVKKLISGRNHSLEICDCFFVVLTEIEGFVDQLKGCRNWED